MRTLRPLNLNNITGIFVPRRAAVTPASRVLLGGLIYFFSYLRNFPHFIETEGSEPCLRQFAACPHSEPYESSPPFQVCFFKVHFNIILPCTHRISRWSTYFKLPLPAHHIPHDLSTLNNIWWGVFKLWSSSLCSFFQSLVTSFTLRAKYPSVPYCKTAAACLLLWIWETRFCALQNNKQNYRYLYFVLILAENKGFWTEC
jgi:hypothetical protein